MATVSSTVGGESCYPELAYQNSKCPPLLPFKSPAAAADTAGLAGWDWLVQTLRNSAKCFSLHVLQQCKVQAALPPSQLLLLMRALYSNPFLGEASWERDGVSSVRSYCGRAGTALLKPMAGQFPRCRSLHPNFPMKPN